MDVVSDAISAVRVGRPFSHQVRAGGRWCARLEPYDGAGFHVVLDGTCWLLPDGGDPVGLGPGDAVLLPHGTGHVIADSPADAETVARAEPFARWGGEGPARGTVPAPRPGETGVVMLCGKYRLDRSHAHPLLAELPSLVHLPDRDGAHPELRAAVGLLAGELGGPEGERPGSGIALPSLLDLLLVYMVRSWMAGSADGIWPAALGDPVAAAALRALHADPAAPWTVDRLAAEAGVSRATLVRRFTARVGRAPMTYLTWWRLTRAAALLRNGTDPLAAVARRVGYGTPYALSHAFRREFGVTPGRYREEREGRVGREVRGVRETREGREAALSPSASSASSPAGS
ncbi:MULTISPECIES: AraC family transcriptional regulator [unclassified Streptomyces]|uniref:AraC family transcriptional regulator n=1 Tax=unclassified Streptomyces TaxID=2593676 RepID=UPI00099C51E9|nr:MULTISPECIES: AraC family transcriptional regulator [unclassified Streptomyces]